MREAVGLGAANAPAVRLAAEVAHDLRSPLASMLLMTEVLQRGQSGPMNAVQRRQMGIIRAGTIGLLAIVDDLLALGTNNRALVYGGAAPFSISAVLIGLRDAVLPIAEQKGLDLVIRAPVADVRIGNRIALQRILLNLVTNALKYTDSGTVEIDVLGVDDNLVLFSVCDTGVGLPDEVLARLQGSEPPTAPTPNARFSSTALGLTIVQELLAELGGGELMIESSRTRGTRFMFALDLPVAEPLEP